MEHPIDKKECTSAMGSIEDALYVLGGKWKLRIIVAIKEGNIRFSEIKKAVHGITSKVLTDELRNLEVNDLIERKVVYDANVRIEYHTTAYTDTLKEVIIQLKNWGFQHRQRLAEKSRREREGNKTMKYAAVATKG